MYEISLAHTDTNVDSSRARADFARKRLGWKTSRGNEDFLNHFDGEIEAMREELQSRK